MPHPKTQLAAPQSYNIFCYKRILFHFNIYNFSLKWHILITYAGDGHWRPVLLQPPLGYRLRTQDISLKFSMLLPVNIFSSKESKNYFLLGIVNDIPKVSVNL